MHPCRLVGNNYELQRGRAQMSAEIASGADSKHSTITLQRGRAQMSAEIGKSGAHSRRLTSTSTGPRSDERGNKVHPRATAPPALTSTGPRSDERGNQNVNRLLSRFLGTSTGPRSDERGNAAYR